MRIVTDAKIPHVEAALGPFGEVVRIPGEDIRRADLRTADALIVRSVTRVDDDLLDGTGVTFVGSATIGTDHIDREALRRRKIGFAHAPGCNANAVSEYVVAALLAVRRQSGSDTLSPGPVGIVGFGNVGARTTTKLRALGVDVKVCDPPVQRTGRVAEPFVDLQTLLDQCPTISLHVPLVREGPDPTAGMLNMERLERPELVINTCRGGVMHETVLQDTGTLAVVDTWIGEPDIDWSLLEGPVVLGSPHVAGYSLEGKIRGTRAMHGALARHLGQTPTWSGATEMGEPQGLQVSLADVDDELDALEQVIQQVYDIEQDNSRLRKVAKLPWGQRGPGFRALRSGAPRRREFEHYRVALADVPRWLDSVWLCASLGALGFCVVEA